MIPATLSSRTFDQLERVAGDAARMLLLFFSMVDGRKRLHREVMEQLADHRSVLRTVIPASADVERMGVRRTALEEFAPRGRAASAYRDLWREIRGRLDSALPGR